MQDQEIRNYIFGWPGYISKDDCQSEQDSSSMLHVDRKKGYGRIVIIAKVLQAAAKTNVSVPPDRAGPLPDQKAEREENKSS